MKKSVDTVKERTETLRRLVALEEENAQLQLRDAEHAAEVARLKRQIRNLMADRDAQDLRLGWVRQLADGQRPRDLSDPR